MDIQNRVMGNQPNDFLHRIAGIVPGYDGYVDRERRRDADKILRTQLARKYTAQRDQLIRVQQALLRSHNMEAMSQVDRLSGNLQHFIDRLSTATYGYAGLFDPIKVEASDLDQLYAFDMALTSGVDQVSSAVDGLETAASSTTPGAPELPAAISRLDSTLTDLNTRFNERADLLTSGNRLPDDQYQSLLSGLDQPAPTPTAPAAPSAGVTNYQGSTTMSDQSQSAATSGNNAASGIAGGDMARYSGSGGSAGVGVTPGSEGTPTTNLNTQGATPPEPGMSNLVDSDQSFTEMPAGADMTGEGLMPQTQIGQAGAAGATASGIETGSSPTVQPGAPGHNIGAGMDIATGDSIIGNDIPTNSGTGAGEINPLPGDSDLLGGETER